MLMSDHSLGNERDTADVGSNLCPNLSEKRLEVTVFPLYVISLKSSGLG